MLPSVAPCQCSWPRGVQTVSPRRVFRTSSPTKLVVAPGTVHAALIPTWCKCCENGGPQNRGIVRAERRESGAHARDRTPRDAVLDHANWWHRPMGDKPGSLIYPDGELARAKGRGRRQTRVWSGLTSGGSGGPTDIRLTSLDSERDTQRRADDDGAMPSGGCLDAVGLLGSGRDPRHVLDHGE